jgi:hypothetical protein
MGWNGVSSARGTPFGNKDRAAEFYSAVVSISEWLCPASLDHRLHQHQYRTECMLLVRGKKKKKLRSPDHACLASRDAEKLIVRRDLSRSLIHLSTENEPEELLQRVHRYSVPRLRCFFHSRSAPSLACIASTMASLSLAPPLWLLPLLITGRCTSQPHRLQRQVHAARPVPCRLLLGPAKQTYIGHTVETACGNEHGLS